MTSRVEKRLTRRTRRGANTPSGPASHSALDALDRPSGEQPGPRPHIARKTPPGPLIAPIDEPLHKGFVTIHWDQVLKALKRPTCRSGFGLTAGGLTGFAWPYFPQFQGSRLFAVMFTYGVIRLAAFLGSRLDIRWRLTAVRRASIGTQVATADNAHALSPAAPRGNAVFVAAPPDAH
jgi:hypothetical protein